jgi:Leucine-rich repeat (LRR) protein
MIIKTNIGEFQTYKSLIIYNEEITKINVSFNELIKLPNEFTKILPLLTNLVELNLSDNHLYELPNEIYELTQLKELDISNTLIKISDDIINLKKLETLKLKNIGEMSEKAYEITNLLNLDLSNNKNKHNNYNKACKIVKISEYMKQSDNITNIVENMCNIFMGININNRFRLSNNINLLKNLQSINLSECDITQLPNQFYLLNNLKEINLSNNKISKLSTKIGNFPQLTNLNLSTNNIIVFPEEIGKLTSLTELNITANDTRYIPSSIWLLTQLKELNISTTKLCELPHKNIQSDVILTISHYFENVPDNIKHLKIIGTRYQYFESLANSLESIEIVNTFDNKTDDEICLLNLPVALQQIIFSNFNSKIIDCLIRLGKIKIPYGTKVIFN